MNQDRTGYFFPKAIQLEQALAILQREMEHQAIPRWREIAFSILNYATYAYGVAAMVFLSCLVYFAMAQSPLDNVEPLVLAYVILCLVGITIIIFFCLNVPYFIRLVRQLLLARRLGLSEALLAPWRVDRRKHRWRRVLAFIIVIISIIIPCLYFTFRIMAFADVHVPKGGWTVWAELLLALSLTGIVIAAIVSMPFMRIAKARLAFVTQLYDSLKEQAQSTAHLDAGLIQVPAETYETIAKIERAQISRERLDIIEKSAASVQDRFTIQKSSVAQEQGRNLDSLTRLRVEDQIDNLTTDPFPEGMSEYLGSGLLHHPVPDTPVGIVYTVDTLAKNVQIISIEQQSDQDRDPQGS